MSEDFDNNRQIVFVSELRNPHTNASSTQIMTKNLLDGFRKLTNDLVLIAIISDERDKEDISELYSSLCDKLFFFSDITNNRSHPFKSKISMIVNVLRCKSIVLPDEIIKLIKQDSIVISHSPSIDSALFCTRLKFESPSVNYIQYWGDPLALSLITPDQYSIRRCVQKWVERKLHKAANRIVYGTKSLYDAQVVLFPEIAHKTSYVEVSYNEDAKDCLEERKGIIIGYYGNYYSNIRNIVPFYTAARGIKGVQFEICGNSDIVLPSLDNIRIQKRISQSAVTEQEEKLDVVICLLNRVGVQIPGKVFYQTNTNKTILIIGDGPRKQSIINELSHSGRFIFCDNTIDDIKNALERIITERIVNRTWDSSMYSPETICKGILGIN